MSRLSRGKVYLAGGIASMTYKEAGQWREKAEELLSAGGFQTLNPLRGKKLRGKYTTDRVVEKFGRNAICHRDLRDVYQCDIVLAEYTNPDHNYTGTTTELTYARMWHKMTVAFTEKNKYSLWLPFLVSRIESTLEDAITWILEFASDPYFVDQTVIDVQALMRYNEDSLEGSR